MLAELSILYNTDFLKTFENKNKIALSHVPLYQKIDNYKMERYIEDLFAMLELDLKEMVERHKNGGAASANAAASSGGPGPSAKAHAARPSGNKDEL